MMADLDGVSETIFVDDGKRDCSAIVLRAKAKEDPRYRFIGLSRNFGHQAAITAGMDAASGDAVIVMDADLQDPPEVVGQMIEKWKEGYEVVYGRRMSREGDSAFKKWTARLFYKFLGRLSSVDIPRDAGDFRLIDRKVLDAFLAMPEQDRFVRGMFAWLGFRQTEVAFHRCRGTAGETKYPFLKMLRLAATASSDFPTRRCGWRSGAVSSCRPRRTVRSLRAGALGPRRPKHGGRLGINHHNRVVPVRHQHDHDRNHGPLCRPASTPK